MEKLLSENQKKEVILILETAYIDGFVNEYISQIERCAQNYLTIIEKYPVLYPDSDKWHKDLNFAEDNLEQIQKPLKFLLDTYLKFMLIKKMQAEANKAPLIVIQDLLRDAQETIKAIKDCEQDDPAFYSLYSNIIFKNSCSAAETARISHKRRQKYKGITGGGLYWTATEYINKNTVKNPLKNPAFDRFITKLVGIIHYAEKIEEYKDDKGKRDSILSYIIFFFQEAEEEALALYEGKEKESAYDYYAPLIVCYDLLKELDDIIKTAYKLPKKDIPTKGQLIRRVSDITPALLRIGHSSYMKRLKELNPETDKK